jgi:DNA recombination protein RmuC
MLYALLVLQFIVLLCLVALLVRKSGSAAESTDPRLAQLVANMPTQITRLDARFDGLDNHLRSQVAELRSETETRNAALRSEIIGNLTTLGDTVRSDLKTARQENESSAERLRSRVQEGLEKLNTDNTAKLEQMRVTVDEKLHATLQTRLTESFGTIAEQLAKVHEGLGEMSSMTSEVKSLSRIFSNVKTRGGVAEEMVETLLEEVLAPGQYQRNVNVRPGTQEIVEFAVKLPGMGEEVWLPIDAKFPREDWERLESANESGDALQLEPARKAFDNAIRAQAKLICSKYINEPITTPYAIMFLPTESMYAEVLRRDGLQSYMHQSCRVMVAGPTNLYALLTSFRLGFRMLNLQKKGDEVWKVLAATQTEFSKFGGLIDKMDKQVGTVQNTIRDLGTRTRAINRTLRDVSLDGVDAALPLGSQGAFDGLLPMLAAGENEPAAED